MPGGYNREPLRGYNYALRAGGHDEKEAGVELLAEAAVAEGGTGGLLQGLRGRGHHKIYLFYDLDAGLPDDEGSLWS